MNSLQHMDAPAKSDPAQLSGTHVADGKASSEKASRAGEVQPVYLTIASVNRYASDCAARAAGERNSRPAPARLVWKWADIAEIPALIEHTAHEICSDLKKLRQPTASQQANGAPLASKASLPCVRTQKSDSVSAVIKEARLGVKNSQEGRRTAQHSRARSRGVSVASRTCSRASSSKSGFSDPREDFLIAACGSLLAGDFANLCDTQVGREASSQSKSVPKPQSMSMINVSASRQLPDGLVTPQTTLHDLSGLEPTDRRTLNAHPVNGDLVEWSQSHDEGGILTLRVRTGDPQQSRSKDETALHARCKDQAARLPGELQASFEPGISPVKEVGRGFRPAPRSSNAQPLAGGAPAPGASEDEKGDRPHSRSGSSLPSIHSNAMRKTTTGPSNFDAFNASLLASGTVMCFWCGRIMLDEVKAAQQKDDKEDR